MSEEKEKPEETPETEDLDDGDKASLVEAVRQALGELLGTGEIKVGDGTEGEGELREAKRTRADVEGDAHEQARRAVKEVMDADELTRLRREKEDRDKAPVPGRARKITRLFWGEEEDR